MAEKATIFQGVQIGVESTEGTAVDADVKLLACSLVPAPKTETDTFRAMGNKYPSFAVLNKEWTEASIEGQLTYNEINYLLSSLLSEPTPAQYLATDAYDWVYTSSTSGEDDGITMTVQQGDATNAWQSDGMRVSGLTFTFNRNEVSLAGTALGQPLTVTGVTLTSSPTSLDPLPVFPDDVCLYMEDTQAALATAVAKTRMFSLEWGLSDKSGLAWPICADPFNVEQEPKLEYKLKLATDATGMGLITSMRAGATKWFRVKCLGPAITTGVYNTFQIDFPAQITEAGEPEDEDGIYLIEFAMTGIHDATWGKSFEITVRCEMTTLDIAYA